MAENIGWASAQIRAAGCPRGAVEQANLPTLPAFLLCPNETREFGSRFVRICRIGSNSNDKPAIFANLFAQHLGVAVQPAHARSVRRFEKEIENRPAVGKTRFDVTKELTDPLPGQPRNP